MRYLPIRGVFRLCVVLFVLAAAGTSRATDLDVTAFTCDAPPVLGYMPGKVVTTSCSVTITTGGALAKVAHARLALESWTVAVAPLGGGGYTLTKHEDRTVDTWEYTNGATFVRQVTLNGDDLIGGGTLDAWLATQYSLGRKLRLAVTLDALDLHAETDELNNTAAQPLVTSGFFLTPLVDRVRFGPVSTRLTSGDVMRVGVGCCAPGTIELASGAMLTWQPGGTFPAQDITTTAALSVTPYATSSAGLELAAAGKVDVPGVSGTLGGIAVTIDAALDERGISASAMTATLPDRHALHEAGALGGPLPRGSEEVGFTSLKVRRRGTLSSIVGTRKGGFLHVEGLPFYLTLLDLGVSSSGMAGRHAGPRYVGDVGFLPEDPRSVVLGIPRVTSNDIRFGRAPLVAQTKPAFRIDARGLTATVELGAGAGTVAFPRVHLAWPAFKVQITRGALKDRQTLPADLAQVFTQSPDCPSCPSSVAGTRYTLTPTGSMGLGSDGAVLAAVTGLPSPSWGPVADAGGHVFARTGEGAPSGKVFLPGFIMRGTALLKPGALPVIPADTGGPLPPTTVGLSVAQSLLGARSARVESGIVKPLVHYGQPDDEARRGNHFAAGVTVGPERYSTRGTLAPAVGIGGDLTGSTTAIRFGGPSAEGGCGGDPCEVVGNVGTRYVVRPAGITGAFNTATPPTPTVYGYNIPFTRFGWRQVLNEVDPFSWNDGAIHVEEPGAFDVSFASLGLTCPGALTEALVIPCDPRDGPSAVNCGEHLHAWQTAMTPLTLRFAPETTAPACDPGEAELEVGASLDIAALDDPITVTAIWEPDGDPKDARVTGRSDNVLERPRDPSSASEDRGFPVALHETVRFGHLGDDAGWFVFTMDFGVSLFDMIKADVRLANTSVGVAAPSVVRAGDGTGAPSLAIDWSDPPPCVGPSDDGCAPRAHYTWGGTGFDIDLPVWFDVDPEGRRAPRFSGMTVDHSLVVMGMQAGVEYATTESVRVTFGASANFEMLAASAFNGTSIDIYDALSVTVIDDVLVSLGVPRVGGLGPIGAIVEGVRAEADAMLQVVGDATEARLRVVLEDHLDMIFAGVSASLGDELVSHLSALRGLPATITSEVTLALGAMLDDALEPFTTALDQEVEELVGLLESILLEIPIPSVAPCDALGTACADALDKLGAIVDALELARGVLQSIADANAALDAIDGALARVDDVVAEAGATIDTSLGLLATLRTDLLGPGGLGVFETPDVEVNPLYVFLLATLVPGVDGVLEQIEDLDFVGNVARLASLIPVPATAAEIESDLVGRAVDLLDEVELVVPSFQVSLEGLDLTSMVDGALAFATDIEGTLVDVDLELGGIRAALEPELGLLEDEVEDLIDMIDAILSLLHRLEDAVRCAQDPACAGTAWTGLALADLLAKLDAEIDTATDGLITTFFDEALARTFVLDLPLVLRSPIDEALANVGATIEALLPDLFELPALTAGADLEATLIDLVVGSGGLELVLIEVSAHFDLLVEDITLLVDDLFAQVDALVAELAVAINDAAGAALEAATSFIDRITAELPIDAASIDGYALVAGDELERLHVDARFTMNGSQEDDTRAFEAALDVTSWATNGKGDACDPAADPSALLDAVISAEHLPLSIGTGEVTIEDLELGFTLEGDGSGPPMVVGIFGGVTTDGAISFNEFDIYDIGFQAGVGLYETYLGATASASFSSMFMSVAFLVGRTCGDEVLADLDPQAAEFITLPGDVFNGVYVRGSASMPIVDFGCLLNLSLTADVGTWLIGGPPLTLGGLVGGGAYGKLGCIGALRGQATLFGELSGDVVKFLGEGFAVAGAGLDCDPETWTTVAKSREDKSCGTGDASLTITYEKGRFDADKPDVSAIH